MSAKPLHSLRLGDENTYLLDELEEQFCIQILDEEAQQLFTVGQLYDLISDKLENVGGNKCASMMAFHKLRAAVHSHAGDISLRPKIAIDDLTNISPKIFHKQIQASCNLHIPGPYTGRVGGIGAWICFASILAVFPMIFVIDNLMLVLGIAFGMFFIGGLLIKFDKGVWGENQQTLGELSHEMLYYNYGILAEWGARSDDSKIWLALINTIDGFVDFGADNEVCRSTRLL